MADTPSATGAQAASPATPPPSETLTAAKRFGADEISTADAQANRLVAILNAYLAAVQQGQPPDARALLAA